MSSGIKHLYEFGPFLLDCPERLLRRGDEVVHLTPKEFDTLLALVRSGGRVVSKEELIKEIWPDTFVEEATLAQNIFTLRKALARADGEHQYVETVPRRGYRFAARVRERSEEVLPIEEERQASAAFVSVEAGAAQAEARPASTPFGSEAPKSEPPAPEPFEPELTALSPAHAPERNGAGANGTGGVSANESAREAKAAIATLEAAARAETQGPKRDGGRPVRAAVLISVAAVLAFAGLVLLVQRYVVRQHVAPRRPAFEMMQITRLPVTGDVLTAAISPDGKYLAYIANSPGGQSIWVRQVAAASNHQQIVPPSEGSAYLGVHFSPDGEHVYFGSVEEGGGQPPTLFSVPVFGGAARKILDNVCSPISFSPDGRRFAFMRGSVETGTSLYVADSDGGNARKLVDADAGSTIFLPAWSPDGETIACAYSSTTDYENGNAFAGVTIFDAATGAERRLTGRRWFVINRMSWLPDGGGLILSASEQELSPQQIWELFYPSGETRRVTNDLSSYVDASLTADGKALVTVQTDRIPNIWVAPGGDATRARQITTGTGKFDGYYGVAWMPDGRVVYSSIAGGAWDIWVMNADGSGQRQLTVGARSNYGPSVSPDGRYIVFVSNRAGAFNIWRMDADGSNPKQLTSGKGENFPHVTPDGRWVIYATVGFAQRNLIWKVPIDGGEPVALTDRTSSWPFVSPDGKFFVCTLSVADGTKNTFKLAVIPIEGGEPVKLFDFDTTFRANTVWLPDNRGIAFLDARTGTNNVWLQPLSGGKPVQLTDFKSDGVVAYDWSRDNRLLATRSIETTGVVLIRDFR